MILIKHTIRNLVANVLGDYINIIGLDPFEVVLLIEINQKIISLLKNRFGERNADIFISRMADEKTLKEISHQYNINCSRVKQIVDKILIKLRWNPEDLINYLNYF